MIKSNVSSSDSRDPPQINPISDSDFLHTHSNATNSGNLTATISSIRSNVTRVLYMYFQNVTDEFGYGAATTTEHPTTTTTTILFNSNNSSFSSGNATSSVIAPSPQHSPQPTSVLLASNGSVATATAAATASSGSWAAQATVPANTLFSTAKTLLHQQLTVASSSAAAATTFNNATSASFSAMVPKAMAAVPGVPVIATQMTLNASNALTTAPSITYPPYRLAIRSYENCSALFANYTQPQQGVFCNWTWDQFLCWPPTPAGVLARMHCPSGWHGIDTKKFANRKCELDGHWGSRPNETSNPIGWTDYKPCFKPEVNELLQQMKDIDVFMDIAKRTRTLEIVGLILSLLALILSLIIFCNFRSLRNNRTKIHKNLFIAMVSQVIIRLTLYLDQEFRRNNQTSTTNTSTPSIENTPILCEASYVLLEYARTAMFMWMFIEGLYLHNMVTVAVFQGRFPHAIFSLLGWGMPVLMTTVWAFCTAVYTDSVHDCLWNYNLTPYYWILEGPRLIVILLNFFFLMNIIRVLVVKLRQSQASDIEQTRKAVRAAIVLLPLLGITNLLHLVPALNFEEPWKFALWSYVAHFLTSFQGFFIALIYCFLNGEVRAALIKCLAVYMSVRGHPEWAPKRASVFSGAYNTAPDTEAQAAAGTPQDNKRNESPSTRRLNGRKYSATPTNATGPPLIHKSLTARRFSSAGSQRQQRRASAGNNNNYNNSNGLRTHIGAQRSNSNSAGGSSSSGLGGSRLFTLCFGGQKVLRVPPASSVPPETNV